MKKPVNFEEAISKNKVKSIKTMTFMASARKPRQKPRSEEESIGLAKATASVVRTAFKSGRIVKKSPKGFVLHERKK